VTTVLDQTAPATADDAATDTVLGPWRSRAAALAVDVLPGLAIVATMVLLVLATPGDDGVRWVFVVVGALALTAVVVNRVMLPAVTGWTLGRALCGLAVRRRDGQPVGIGRFAVREAAHLLDTLAVFVGWLWPLWDKRRRTFADLLTRTEVHRAEPPARGVRRLVGIVVVVAALLCAAGAGLAYAVVYRHERAVDQAAAQITEQGPRIVEQMLSYGKDTINDDFARAQSLTTDGYRPQLTAQQDAVRKAGVTDNEYWAVSSALLTNPPVSPNQAAMLLAMQGQRGTDAQSLKFITATVRVDFDRGADGRWRVANLTVLKKPQMNQAGAQ
jgi:Mce-associated membrane protein